jgi:DNA-binding XRE family transcriptional regulator
VGFTLRIRCGYWAQYFLNEERCRHKSGYYEYGILSEALLHDLMSLWHHHEGAARLMTWLLFKIKVNCSSPLTVEMLMKVAFGTSLVEEAKAASIERKKLVRRWETALKILLKKGWGLKPDPETYPSQYWPSLDDSDPLAQIPDDPEEAASFWAKDAVEDEGTRLLNITKRSRGSFERLLSGRLWVQPPADIAEKLEKIDNHRKPPQKKTSKSPRSKPTQAENTSNLNGEQVRELRKAKGWSTRKLAAEARISQSMIVLIEKGVDKGGQPISPTFQMKLKKAFGLM